MDKGKGMKKANIPERSFHFSINIIELYQLLIAGKEYIISKQLLRRATGIGANVNEASAAFSRRDFTYKMSVASRSAIQTRYRLRILEEGKLVSFDLSYYTEEIVNIISTTSAM
jgi:four helix bundle protein